MKRMILGMTFASIFLAAALGLQAVEILPLAEIKAGMKGEWVTSVEGQKLERFPLEIVGISRNFAAPGRDVIWARALDERNIATGPVAGMSGSPVYIEGKWVGAYAYGFLWPKDEALIGIQPAQEMLKLWEAPEGLSSASQAQQPLTLALAGFSARTVEAFAPSFEKLGLDIKSGAALGKMESASQKLEAGSPLAAVLMDGDFGIAAVGTVSALDEKSGRLLAFGHPFMGRGKSDVPLANAEVVTVVSTLDKSFKLANVGEIIGAITLDRMPGIVGQVGLKPELAEVEFDFKKEGYSDKKFAARLWADPQVAPIIAGMAFMEALGSLDGLGQKQRLAGRVEARVEHNGRENILSWEFMYSQEGAEVVLASRLGEKLAKILDNPYETVKLKSLTVSAELKDGWERYEALSLTPISARARAGEAFKVALVTQGYRKELRRDVFEIQIPKNAEGSLKLALLDFAKLREENNALQKSARDFAQLLRSEGEEPLPNRLLARLSGAGGSAILEGGRLNDLPPTTLMNLEKPSAERVLAENEWTFEAPITLGEGRFELEIKVEK